jgi:hypothetical protein
MLRFYGNKKRKSKLHSLYQNRSVNNSSELSIGASIQSNIDFRNSSHNSSEHSIEENTASNEESNSEDDDDYYNDDNQGQKKKSTTDNSTPTELMHQDIKKQLTDANLTDHLCFDKSPQAVITILNRVTTFIVWAFNKGKESSTEAPDALDAMFILHKFITVNYQIAGEFCSYLRDEMNFEYSTVSNWMFDIKKVCEWFAVFRADRHTVYITSASECKDTTTYYQSHI